MHFPRLTAPECTFLALSRPTAPSWISTPKLLPKTLKQVLDAMENNTEICRPDVEGLLFSFSLHREQPYFGYPSDPATVWISYIITSSPLSLSVCNDYSLFWSLRVHELTIVPQAGFAAALNLLIRRLGARTFDNLLRDTAVEFVGAASRRLLRTFVNDALFAGLQQRLAGQVPDWLLRLLNPPEEEEAVDVPG